MNSYICGLIEHAADFPEKVSGDFTESNTVSMF